MFSSNSWSVAPWLKTPGICGRRPTYQSPSFQYSRRSRIACDIGNLALNKSRSESAGLVRMRGLEPPLPCENMDLNHARLPVPPHPHVDKFIFSVCGT